MGNNKPLLSIGMIVKNEEEHLEKCLKALEPLRNKIDCELVIADTGSTDKTKEIAQKYADILFDFEWINDFSAARNAVMDRCSGKWYLSLDADEYLDPDIDELLTFFKSEYVEKATSMYVAINNYLDPNDKEQYSLFYAQRLVNMSTGVRFFGSIHEVFEEKSHKLQGCLKKTVFWHDGYINNLSLITKEKGKRNLELIEKEIEKNPDNILRVFQAIESSYTPEQLQRYSRKIVELVNKKVENSEVLAPTSYSHAIRTACMYEMPELEEWMETAFNRYPNSLYTKIDVSYMAIFEAKKKENYKDIVKYGNIYFDGIYEMDNGKSENELRFGSVSAGKKNNRESVAMDMALSYAHLYEFDKCKELLLKYPVWSISIGNIMMWCSIAYYIWQKIDLSDLFKEIGERLYQCDNLDELTKKRKDIFEQRTKNEFYYTTCQNDDIEITDDILPDRPAYPIIADLGNCDLGNAAMVMLAEDVNEIEFYINRIDKWRDIPFTVYMYLIIKNVRFSEKFYLQTSNEIENIAGSFMNAVGKNNIETVFDWVKCCKNEEYSMDLLWRYDILIAIFRYIDWKDKESIYKYHDVIKEYLILSEKFLDWYYNPNLLTEKTILVLPSMHCFAWFMIQYEKSEKYGNSTKSISWLKKALDVAPSMKNFINSMLQYSQDNEKKIFYEEASPELLILAQKVRIMLDAYPNDDPAVQEIKKSEIYKKVAYLIERPVSDYKM